MNKRALLGTIIWAIIFIILIASVIFYFKLSDTNPDNNTKETEQNSPNQNKTIYLIEENTSTESNSSSNKSIKSP